MQLLPSTIARSLTPLQFFAPWRLSVPLRSGSCCCCCCSLCLGDSLCLWVQAVAVAVAVLCALATLCAFAFRQLQLLLQLQLQLLLLLPFFAPWRLSVPLRSGSCCCYCSCSCRCRYRRYRCCLSHFSRDGHRAPAETGCASDRYRRRGCRSAENCTASDAGTSRWT